MIAIPISRLAITIATPVLLCPSSLLKSKGYLKHQIIIMDSVAKFGYYEAYVACGGYQKPGVLDGEDVFACRQFPVLLYNL